GNRFLIGINDEHQVRNRSHVLNAAQRAVELFALTIKVQTFLLGEALSVASQNFVKLAQTLDRIGNGLPVGHHAAEPAGVDVILGRTIGRVSNDVRSLTLRTNEQNASAASDRVRNDLQRIVQQRNGLG